MSDDNHALTGDLQTAKIIFGGTFDPPHRSHSALWRHLGDVFPQASLVVMPSYRPLRWGSGRYAKVPRACYAHRCEMVRALLSEEKISAEVSTLEEQLTGGSFMDGGVPALKVVRALTTNTAKSVFGSEEVGVSDGETITGAEKKACQKLIWVIGQDLLAHLHRWYRAREFLSLVTLCVVRRDHGGFGLLEAVSQSLERLAFDPRHHGEALISTSAYGGPSDPELTQEGYRTLYRSDEAHWITLSGVTQWPGSSTAMRRYYHHSAIADTSMEASAPMSFVAQGGEAIISPAVDQYIKDHHLYPPLLKTSSPERSELIEEICLGADQFKAVKIEVLQREASIAMENDGLGWDEQVLLWCRSPRHVQALARELISEIIPRREWPVRASEGSELGEWIAMDLGPVIIHLFDSTAMTHREPPQFIRRGVQLWQRTSEGWRREVF